MRLQSNSLLHLGWIKLKTAPNGDKGKKHVNMEKIKVKVLQIPGKAQEVELEDDHTVAAALKLAQIDNEGYTMKVRGKDVELDTELKAGQKLVLAEDIEGN